MVEAFVVFLSDSVFLSRVDILNLAIYRYDRFFPVQSLEEIRRFFEKCGNLRLPLIHFHIDDRNNNEGQEQRAC